MSSRTAWTSCQDSHCHPRISRWKLYSKKSLTMWALWNSLTRRYLSSKSHNNWLYAAAITNKKTSQQNPFAHHQLSVKLSDDVSWQDKIGLHQFDNYLSQVKINVRTVNSSCFLRYSRYLASSSSFSRTVPRHWEPEAISFLACNLAKCWLILKILLQAHPAVNLQ